MNKTSGIFLSVLVLVVLFYSCQKDERSSSIRILNPQGLDSVLDHFVEEDFYPFIYARLEDFDGNLLYEHGTVNQRVLPNSEVNGDTWFRVWSMSKIVTISVVLDLVEDGLLKLNDPVTKYIPEFKDLKVAVSNNGESLIDFEWGHRDQVCPVHLVENDSVMTLLHLMDHEAGFYYATTGFECLDSLVASQNLPTSKNSDEFIQRLAKLPLIQHSGTEYFYGINTTVLGIVAERVTGKNLSQLVEERVANSLKIEGLQYRLPKGKTLFPIFTGRDSVLRIAERGELDIFGPDVPDYKMDHELYLGGEGMLATADGYTDFIRMLLHRGELNGHRFLDKETVEDIYAPHTQKDSPYGYNGYNLWISGDTMRVMNQGEAGLWIGGGYECTYFWADPKRNFVGIIMSQNNEVRPPGYELNDKFRGEIYKQLWENEKNR